MHQQSSIPALSGPVRRPMGKPQQILIFLHGYGADGNDLFGLAAMFAEDFPKALILSPDAPFPCEMGFGRQWFGLSSRELADMNEGARMVAPALRHFIQEIARDHELTLRQVALIGFSQGTMMALEAALHLPAPVGAVVGFSGLLLNEGELATGLTARPPVLLIHGTRDAVVPYAALPAAEASLKSLSVPVQSVTRPGLGHGIDDEGLAAARRFLQQHLQID